MQPLSENDLNHILNHTQDLWEELRGEQLFLTGGTGFFGCWLLESFFWANNKLNLDANITVLSRDPEKFLVKMPHLANNPSLHFVKGDVCDFKFPEGRFAYVIHAATESGTSLGKTDPQRMFNTIVDGTRRTIEFARSHGTKKFLLISSGAVYGKQPQDLSQIPEDYRGAPDPLDPRSAYGEGKRAAELLCTMAAQTSDIEMKIARCFAFVGPHLPLDAHFAIGNFIRDALKGGPIVINGDGTPLRSYLYASDLAIWLWTILMKGQNGRAYNVGSDEAFSIKSVAYLVGNTICKDVKIIINQQISASNKIEQYIPLISKAGNALGLKVNIPPKDAISRTAKWIKKQ